MTKQLALNLVIDAKTGKLVGELAKGETGLDKFERKVKKTDAATSKSTQTVGQFSSAFKLLGGAVAGVSLGYLVKQLYEGIDAIQGMEAQLKTTTGSVGGAALALDRLTDFAKKTPFTINQSVEAFTRLTNMGLNPSEKAMLSYGNTAAAMGLDMMQMVEAVADAAVGEFERLKQFGIKAKNNGESIAFTFQGQTKSIKNDAASIEEYLQGIGENEFAGAMTDQMGKLSSKMNNVGIETQLLAKSLGDQGLTAIFDGVIDSLGGAVKVTTAWIKESGILTSVISEGGAFIADIFSALEVVLKTSALGWLTMGEYATGAMAASADAVAGLINAALEPLLNVLSAVAEGWGYIFEAMAEFTGSETMGAAAASLSSFSKTVKEFSVSGDDITKLHQKMGAAVVSTTKDIEALKNANAGDKVRQWVYENVTAINEQKEAAKEAAKAIKEMAGGETVGKVFDSADLNDLIKDVDKLGDSWKNTGDTMTDAFGSIADQIDKMVASFEMFSTMQEDFDKQRKDANTIQDLELREKTLAELDKYEGKMQTERLQSTVGGFASMAGAASEMFDEQSKGRETLHRLEQAFTIIEVGLALKKAAANAMAAIAGQGQGDPYTAFARIAAMAALMAGLGLFSGSVSGAPVSSADRQKDQGTGTTLGSDEKSASINNSTDRMIELETEQYAELREMNNSLKMLNSYMSRLATSLVGGYGKFDGSNYGGEIGSKSTTSKFEKLLIGAGLEGLDPTGIMDKIISGFSKTKTSIEDSGISIVGQTIGNIIETGLANVNAYYDVKTKDSSWWGLKTDTKYTTEYESLDNGVQREIGLVFTSLADSITSAVELLGFEVGKELVMTNFTNIADLITAGNFDFESGKPFLNNIFSDYFESITGVLGEEATKTLDNFKINLSNVSFKDMSGEEIEAELQAIFSKQADLMTEYLIPAIAEYQKVGEGLYDTLVRVAQEQAIFNSNMDAIGLQLGRFGDLTKETETAITQSLLDLMGGIENYMDQVNVYFSEFFTEAEQFDYLASMISDQFESLGQVIPQTRDEFRSLVDGIDLTTQSGQQLFAALMSLVPSMDSYFDSIEQQVEVTQEATQVTIDTTKQLLSMTVDLNRELARMDMTPVQLAIEDILLWKQAAIEAAEEVGATDFTLIEKIAERRLADVIKGEVDSIERQIERLASNTQREVDSLEQTFSDLARAISETSATIGAAILNIQKQQPNFNANEFYSNQVSDLRESLGQGTVKEQLKRVNTLNTAINDRYQAELAEIENSRAQAEAAHQQQMNAYNEQVSAIETMNDAAKALKKASQDLLIGNLSPLTAGEQLAEAEAQFNEILRKARGGDADAIGQLKSSGEQYLGLAQQYKPANYQDVFSQVYGAFTDVGSKEQAIPPAPSPHFMTLRYQEAAEQLAVDTIAELKELQLLTDELNATAGEEMEATIGTLQAQAELDAQLMRDSIDKLPGVIEGETAQMVKYIEAQTQVAKEQLAAINAATAAIVDAIGTLPAPIVNVPAPIVNVPAPVVNVPAPIVNIQKQETDNGMKDFSRDLSDLIDKIRDDRTSGNDLRRAM